MAQFWNNLELFNLSCTRFLKSFGSQILNLLSPLYPGTSAATPGVFSLCSGSCSGGGSSGGHTTVTETNLPRDFGPHQGGVSVPADTVPQVSVFNGEIGPTLKEVPLSFYPVTVALSLVNTSIVFYSNKQVYQVSSRLWCSPSTVIWHIHPVLLKHWSPALERLKAKVASLKCCLCWNESAKQTGFVNVGCSYSLLHGVLDVQECTRNAFLNGGFGLTLERLHPLPPISVLEAHLQRVPRPSRFPSHPALI